MARLKGIQSNMNAFLDMIAYSEGTSKIGNDDGYNVIVGGKMFDDYQTHPNILVSLPKLGIKQSAAGRYQLLKRYFNAYSRQLKLSDFSPESQDKIAIQQIKERKAINDIESGKIKEAIHKCRNIWASLPDAGYGQHEHNIETLLEFYNSQLNKK